MQGAYETPSGRVVSMYQPSFEYGGSTGSAWGSDTSKANATWRDSVANTVQARVMNCIHSAGYDGRTCKEIENLLGMTHQSVSASIRNMELDGYDETKPFSAWNCGKVVKLKITRGGQHAYVTRGCSRTMMSKDLEAPNPRRLSYKSKYDSLRKDISSLMDEMSNDYSWTWYEKLNKIYQENQ